MNRYTGKPRNTTKTKYGSGPGFCLYCRKPIGCSTEKQLAHARCCAEREVALRKLYAARAANAVIGYAVNITERKID